MGQTVEQIEAYIEDRREELGSNLNELGRKVESVADWRGHFRRRPMTWMGIAFGAGVLCSLSAGHGTRRKMSAVTQSAATIRPSSDGRYDEALALWRDIKGALFGVAATRLTAYVNDMLPGFDEHFERTRAGRRAAYSPRSA